MSIIHDQPAQDQPSGKNLSCLSETRRADSAKAVPTSPAADLQDDVSVAVESDPILKTSPVTNDISVDTAIHPDLSLKALPQVPDEERLATPLAHEDTGVHPSPASPQTPDTVRRPSTQEHAKIYASLLDPVSSRFSASPDQSLDEVGSLPGIPNFRRVAVSKPSYSEAPFVTETRPEISNTTPVPDHGNSIELSDSAQSNDDELTTDGTNARSFYLGRPPEFPIPRDDETTSEPLEQSPIPPVLENPPRTITASTDAPKATRKKRSKRVQIVSIPGMRSRATTSGLPPPRIIIEGPSDDESSQDMTGRRGSSPVRKKYPKSPLPTFRPQDGGDVHIGEHPRIKKRKLFVRKTRRVVMRSPILKLLLGRQLASQTQPVLKLMAEGIELDVDCDCHIPLD